MYELGLQCYVFLFLPSQLTFQPLCIVSHLVSHSVDYISSSHLGLIKCLTLIPEYAQKHPILIMIRTDAVLPVTFHLHSDQCVIVRVSQDKKAADVVHMRDRAAQRHGSAMHTAAVQHVLKRIHFDMES